eukprot:m.796677 g.796677  ORF g.796677 m.796677 type:complete len:386 (-) comp59247_c0_seq4:286-1443(-)
MRRWTRCSPWKRSFTIDPLLRRSSWMRKGLWLFRNQSLPQLQCCIRSRSGRAFSISISNWSAACHVGLRWSFGSLQIVFEGKSADPYETDSDDDEHFAGKSSKPGDGNDSDSDDESGLKRKSSKTAKPKTGVWANLRIKTKEEVEMEQEQARESVAVADDPFATPIVPADAAVQSQWSAFDASSGVTAPRRRPTLLDDDAFDAQTRSDDDPFAAAATADSNAHVASSAEDPFLSAPAGTSTKGFDDLPSGYGFEEDSSGFGTSTTASDPFAAAPSGAPTAHDDAFAAPVPQSDTPSDFSDVPSGFSAPTNGFEDFGSTIQSSSAGASLDDPFAVATPAASTFSGNSSDPFGGDDSFASAPAATSLESSPISEPTQAVVASNDPNS